jgi:hypothetical protein
VSGLASLFDDGARNDASPGRHSEDSFSFLNRAVGEVWERIRAELDRWYLEFPDETGDLRQRFRSRRPSQHYPAWWELYVHRLFGRLGYELEPHPAVPNTRRRPDFLATRDRSSFYVEAVTVFSGVRDPGRRGPEAEVLDAIDTIGDSRFHVMVDFRLSATNMPRRRRIIEPIETWLAGLDPDDVIRECEAGRLPPTHSVSADGWTVHLQAFPVGKEHRDRPDHRLVGSAPPTVGYVDDQQQVRDALQDKRKAYGTPDRPMLVALLSLSTFMADEVVAASLYGSLAVSMPAIGPGPARLIRRSDGAWLGPRGPRATRTSAALVGIQVLPASCANKPLTLWHNPWAAMPVEVDLPFRGARVVDDEVVFTEPTADPSEIVGLPPDWPGLPWH